ncbi:tetratricopeptide repeat-containing serine protease family protein [Pedobacter sp. V48]|uniref:tetratricopeptide repeat-containing S1 family peptidase n=1 Tax=Pedobacter sp. V48 TaxID=509635 RepID=UPI0004BA6CD9|nr:tetratricopeptide repeat-containing serine protease family protein [Pedobacter sp. V48]
MTARNLIVLCLLFSPFAGRTQVRENWMDKPVSAWPRIALVNHVQYKNGDRYVDPSFKYAATGFLIGSGKDTLAATAKHILWIAKNRKTKSTEINNDLEQWVMTPKGMGKDSALIGRLLNEDPEEQLEGKGATSLDRDWIVFSTTKVASGLYPLKPRYTQVKPGEKVYILSCAYEDSLCTVHEGRVYKKLGMDILIRRDMKTHKGGCSGSPVIDANGYLIGVLSRSSYSEHGNVSVAISTEYLKEVLNKNPSLNIPKKDYGELLYHTVLKDGTEKAMRQYRDLIKDPQNYYTYNLYSPDRNGLRETGEKLILLGRYQEAIEMLKFAVKMTGGFYVNYNLLGKAQLLGGNKDLAIKAYQAAVKANEDKGNEAYAELEKLQAKP